MADNDKNKSNQNNQNANRQNNQNQNNFDSAENKNRNAEDRNRTAGLDPSQTSRVGGEAGITNPNQNKDMNVDRTGTGTTDQGTSGRQNKQDWEKNKRE